MFTLAQCCQDDKTQQKIQPSSSCGVQGRQRLTLNGPRYFGFDIDYRPIEALLV